MIIRKYFIAVAACVCLFVSCTEKTDYQFELLGKDHTGLDFKNNPQQTAEFNFFNYMYFFNGGGVAAGDFNKDGLIDLFFTSNQEQNKMFLNTGNLKFKDITEAAGLKGQGAKGWTTGVSLVDINNDGLLDIYVNQVGDYLNVKSRNLLFICDRLENEIPIFKEKAEEYGLDLVGFSTQATFFDYDLDGDLDMYQLNHSLHQNGTFGQRKSFINTFHPTAGDKFLRNDNGKFVDVTKQTGINSSAIGYGLGIATGDFNLDGWPDIYIGNDFHENDYLYINQQDGTFKELLTEQIMHTSRFSMGVDVADINNDIFPEIISLDMLPEDPFILKSSLGEDDFGIFQFKLGYGYNEQYARNNLQLNNGDGTFSEIGAFANVHATDWSWASLFFDFDNDGYKDLFVSNGIPRRMNDIDYANFRQSNEDVKWKQQMNEMETQDLSVIDSMPRVKLRNKFFKNSGSLYFTDIENRIQNDLPTFSYGSAYADLDNDGDLDVVVNNIEDEPFIYKNLENEKKLKTGNFIALELKGPDQNINAIGSKIIVFKGNERMSCDNYPVRGYQSSVQLGLHLGVGDTTKIDSVILIWPDQTYFKLSNFRYNKLKNVQYTSGLKHFDYSSLNIRNSNPFNFAEVTEGSHLDLTHKENPFVEFNREILIPHMVSSEGPGLAIGDINGDGLEDVFFGSSKRMKSKILFQMSDGTFTEKTSESILLDSTFEDVDAKIVDIDNDGDRDLIVASGGNEYWGESEYLKQRLYINDGKGIFRKMYVSDEALLTASCVLAEDFDSDGLVDLFYGARAIPFNYGKTPRSYLFKNLGNLKFKDVTNLYSDELQNVGLVKDGEWYDMDGDGDKDLILATEWGPLKIFFNNKSKLSLFTISDHQGWWNFVLPGDFDHDGDIDLIAGNTGKNSKLKPSFQYPVKLYVNDFDANGQVEQILTYFLKGKETPFASHRELTKQIPTLKRKYLYSKKLAKANLADIFGMEKLNESLVLTANCFESALFENVGKGMKFKFHALPDNLQFSTLETGLYMDVNQDGVDEVLLGGNFYDCNVEMGRYDSNFGNVLTISDSLTFKSYSLGDLQIKDQVRSISAIKVGGQTYFIFAKNNSIAQIIKSSNDKGKNLKAYVQPK